jgi:hypothetical protein
MNWAINKLHRARDELDQIIADKAKAMAGNVESTRKALSVLTAEVAEAQASLAGTSERVAEAAREYVNGTGRGRLLRFVRERATGADYAKHLGLIAAVRKDFTDLSVMIADEDETVTKESMRQVKAFARRVKAVIKTDRIEGLLSHEEKLTLLRSTGVPWADKKSRGSTFERIILYIDDLDRCPPQKVVDVLQAVHLLLTFPLFVVVVAVDARWISRSLERHYDGLLERNEPNDPALGATAMDYLEKIFQVPYWVRPMTPKGSRDLLVSRAAPSVGGARRPDRDRRGDASSDSRDPPEPTLNPPLRDAAVALKDNETSNPPESVPDPASSVSKSSIDPEPPMKRHLARTLSLTKGEQAFMRLLAPYAGRTPRRALRFLNVYRVVKASLSPNELRKLDAEGGYRGLMVQLAISCGSPGLQKRWIEMLDEAPPNATLRWLKTETWLASSTESRYLSDTIAAFWSPPQLDDGSAVSEVFESVDTAVTRGIADLQYYRDLANRYSFGG